jgi:hypothetical protein
MATRVMGGRYTVGSVRARRDQLVLGAAAAAVLIAIVVFAAPGGVRETAEPEATPMVGRPLFGGSLEAGVRYRTRSFIPQLSFVVSDRDWIVQDASRTDYLRLDRRIRTDTPGSELPPRSWLTFSRVTQVHNPDLPRRNVEAALGDPYAWMKRHPDLVVGPAEPITVAGIRGQSFHVTVSFSRPARAAGACRPLLVVCTSVAPDRYYPDGTRLRTIVLPLDGGPFVIDVQGQTQRDLDEVEVPATAVLRSLRLDVTRP